MASFNHFVSALLNPFAMGVLLLLATAILAVRALRRPTPRARGWVFGLVLASLLWFWLWGTLLASWCLSRPLEGAYPAIPADAAPSAEAIVILGGGTTCATNGAFPYPDLADAADRVWHGVRLYRAGKAPRIVATGFTPSVSTRPLLLDFGVPPDAITCIDNTRNTEEESLGIASLLPPGAPILLVTSAAHMRRAELLFRHAGLGVFPAPTDHETSIRCADGFAINWLYPDVTVFTANCALFKELYAGWAYRHIRGFRPKPPPAPAQ